jgi:hypothetical protein
MMPVLSLVYNSGGGNDLLGVGWGLNGLSTITRCPATMAQDGFRGTVSYGPDDRFVRYSGRVSPHDGAAERNSPVTNGELSRQPVCVPRLAAPVNLTRTIGRLGADWTYTLHDADNIRSTKATTAAGCVPSDGSLPMNPARTEVLRPSGISHTASLERQRVPVRL